MQESERIPMSSFPDYLHDQAIEHISRFSVGLHGIDVGESAEVLHQSGSGTLVELDGIRCIVTADHVIEDIRHHDRVGLLIDWQGGVRRCVFEKIQLNYVSLPRGRSVDTGPDLGAILLPPVGDGLATLKAHKVFYDLRRRIDRFTEGFIPLTDGVWLPCGVLAEDSRVLLPEGAFAAVTGHWAMVGIAPTPVEAWRDGFDYLDLHGRPGVDPDMPTSFEGGSGGGLWHGLVNKYPDGRMEWREFILAGVMFYQSALEDGLRTLRSHGRASLHLRLADAIRHAQAGHGG